MDDMHSVRGAHGSTATGGVPNEENVENENKIHALVLCRARNNAPESLSDSSSSSGAPSSDVSEWEVICDLNYVPDPRIEALVARELQEMHRAFPHLAHVQEVPAAADTAPVASSPVPGLSFPQYTVSDLQSELGERITPPRWARSTLQLPLRLRAARQVTENPKRAVLMTALRKVLGRGAVRPDHVRDFHRAVPDKTDGAGSADTPKRSGAAFCGLLSEQGASRAPDDGGRTRPLVALTRTSKKASRKWRSLTVRGDMN